VLHVHSSSNVINVLDEPEITTSTTPVTPLREPVAHVEGKYSEVL
jgi:hypothetical protein